MNIIVCIKRVPMTQEVDLEIDGAGTGVATDDLAFLINDWDNYAVEEAVQIQETLSGTVTAVTVGSEEDEEVLRRALAMGADRAVRIDPGDRPLDSFVVSRLLAAAVADMEHDLVLTGVQADDDNAGAVGVSSDARRDDTLPGNKLVGGIDGGAALANATLEYCAAGAGQQVRVKPHAYPWSNPLLVDAGGLYVAYDDDSIVMGEAGLEVDWGVFPGNGVLAFDGDHWFVVYDDETIGGGGGMLHVLVDGETIVAAPGGGIHVIAAWPLVTNEHGVGLLHGDSLDATIGGLNVKCKPGGGVAYDHEGVYVTGLTASDISDFADAVDARIAAALANHTMGGADETGPPCANWSPVT